MDEIRKCKKCGDEKHYTLFPLAGVIKGISYYRHLCTPCYSKTKLKRKHKIREWLTEHKKNLFCAKCGDDDFRVLDFHHHNDDKDFAVGYAIQKGYSIAKIEREMAKCECLCCKCHRILHWEEKHGA